jgi:thiol-disulfide isomerase/thioredoxin
LVINFWASWCGPCRSEAPELVKLNNKYHKKVQIFAVNLTSSDTESGVKAFVKEFGFDFPVLLDQDGKVAKLYDVTGIPTTYFISTDGIIIDRILGFGGKDMLESKFRNLAE